MFCVNYEFKVFISLQPNLSFFSFWNFMETSITSTEIAIQPSANVNLYKPV